jgi:isopenicillin-N N-acyltransferase-like protein
MHGEAWKREIGELVEIRAYMMREKNAAMTPQHIEELAAEQWQATREYDAALFDECLGLCEGAGLSVTDLVILNNYTDFRDIEVVDQGCSVAFTSYRGNPVAGQTWDMHGSAKRYVCCMEVPCPGYDQPAVMFSLVGCLGMMGFHPAGHMVGVNNINTNGARSGTLWPVLIRRVLGKLDADQRQREIQTAPVTSGHCYLLASREAGEFWEVMPGLAERISRLDTSEDGYIFHTNHCLGSLARLREMEIGKNSTTYVRYDLMERKMPEVRTFDDMYELMNDHENYPKSICSNFQTDSHDPSITCGGAVGELKSGRVVMWRGDERYDENFIRRDFELGVPDLA